MVARKTVLALIGVALFSGARANAEPGAGAIASGTATPTAAARSSAPHTGDPVLSKLQSNDASTLQQGIAALLQHKSAAGEAALTARLHDGLPPQLCAQAIDALVVLKTQSAIPVVTELLQHRRVDVRARALSALAALAPFAATAQRFAISALEDPAAEVQTAAVDALIAMRARAAIPALFTAYDHGHAGAITGVGTLGGPAVVAQLLARAKDGVVDPLVPAFDRLLARTDFPHESKRELVRKLGKLESPSAQRYLVGLGERLKTSPDAKLEQELNAALQTPAPETAPSPTRANSPASTTVAVKGATP